MTLDDIREIGITGAGTMGSGIAQVFAAAGYPVVLTDVADAALTRALGRIGWSLDRLVARGRMDAAARQAALARLHPGTRLEDLRNADLVIEAAPEDPDLKIRLLRDLDALCRPETILASNTSACSITRLAAATNRPDRVIGMHFMNPAPLLPLVELVRALQTADAVYATAEAIVRRIGKTPVGVRNSPGFVSNRVLMPMINEAIFVLQEGIATATAIDDVMKQGMNHPMGPLALADLIGLDTCLAIMNVLYDGFNDPKFRPCPLLREMVDAGYLGRKSGRGFYDYPVENHLT